MDGWKEGRMDGCCGWRFGTMLLSESLVGFWLQCMLTAVRYTTTPLCSLFSRLFYLLTTKSPGHTQEREHICMEEWARIPPHAAVSDWSTTAVSTWLQSLLLKWQNQLLSVRKWLIFHTGGFYLISHFEWRPENSQCLMQVWKIQFP